jgi:hypothetical protein
MYRLKIFTAHIRPCIADCSNQGIRISVLRPHATFVATATHVNIINNKIFFLFGKDNLL